MVGLELCPLFSFISHRWTKTRQCLGLHNELLLVLACSNLEYIWLDLACVPQDEFSRENGNVMKLIWNMDRILVKSEDFLSYYATDGLRFPQPNSDNNKELLKYSAYNQENTSNGVLQLYGVYHASNTTRQVQEVSPLYCHSLSEF